MHHLSKRLIIWALVVAALLLIPFAAMQFTRSVDWSVSDFIFMGALLYGAALIYELIARTGGSFTYRAAVGVAVIAVVLLVWITGAVGIIGDGPINVLYGAVPVTLAVGAVAAGLQARRLVYVLALTALIQALVPVAALLMWNPEMDSWSPGVAVVFMLNAVFVAMFVVSALLLRNATQAQH